MVEEYRAERASRLPRIESDLAVEADLLAPAGTNLLQQTDRHSYDADGWFHVSFPRARCGSADRAVMKADYEVDAINRFMAFLKATRGIDYAITGEDVIVDQATGTNYDYRLEAPGGALPLAVEIFRLIESEEEIAERRHLGVVWDAIKTEFASAGLEDLFVHTPYESPVRPRKASEFAKGLAALVVRETSARPGAKKIRLDGGFEIERIDGLGAVVCGSHSDASWIDSVGIATPPL